MKNVGRRMKRCIAFMLSLIMVLSVCNVSAWAAASTEAASETKKVTVDGVEYTYEVTTPAGYDANDENTNYPVLFVLPDDGITGNAAALTEALSAALASDAIMNTIVVKPSFVSVADNDKASVYDAVSAIITKVDDEYNTVASPSARAVLGTKVGGYLATILTYTDGKGAWNGTPDMFGMMASIHGDFTSEANVWKSVYGDFYAIATKNGEGDGNFSTEIANKFYTFMDAASEDALAYADGGANDIISYYIKRGGAYPLDMGFMIYYYYAMYGNADSYVLDLTSKNSAYDDAFIKTSVTEAVEGIGDKLVQNMITGKILLTPQAALASVEGIKAVYELSVNSLYTSFCGDVENEMEIVISMTDSDTGEKVAEDKVVKLNVKETKDGAVYTNADAPLTLPNTINNISTNVTLAVKLLGKEIVIETKPLVRIAATGTAPEEQLIDLLGNWKFYPFKSFEEGGFTVGTLPTEEQYSEWEEVYPCLAWWNSDFSKQTNMAYYAGYAWYVKEFEIPATFPEGEYYVPVGFFDETDVCFINGVQIGCTGLNEKTWTHEADCWDTERIYSISSEHLNIGGKNVMTVLTHNQSGDGGWYAGHPGLYSAAAYNKMTSKPSTFASEEETAIVKATVDAQIAAMTAKDIDAYAKTVDAEYFQSGNDKNMLLDEVESYITGRKAVTVTDVNPLVFKADDMCYYQATRTIKKADGKTITVEVTDYFKVVDGTAILYGEHDRFYEQFIESKYRADAMGSSAKTETEKFLVYLPKGYFAPENADKRYPTAYVLHQLNSSSNSYAIDGLDKALDAGIASGAIKDTILIIPDSTGESWWHNGWDSMVVEEILEFVDEHYRTIADSRYRFTAGASMGGHGSYYIGLTNPNLFSGMISFFGALNMTENPLNIALAQSGEYLDYYTHYFVCGNRDLYKFGVPAITLDKKLREHNIPHFFELEEGEHSSAFYVPYVIDAFAYQTDAMPTVSAEKAAAVVNGSVTNTNVTAGKAVVTAEINVTDAVSEFLQTIPESSYTVDTTPELNIPVTASIIKNGEVLAAETSYLAVDAATTEDIRIVVKGADLVASENYDVRLTAGVLDQTVELAASTVTAVKDAVVYTTVKPIGQTMDSIKVTVSDKSALAGLKAEDFTFAGQACGWMNPELHAMEGVTISKISTYKNVLTLVLEGVTDRHVYVDNFTITCSSRPDLTFTSAQVSKTIAPVADEFEKVRNAGDGTFDYNIYKPENAEGALPVVIAFHGFGDNENLYMNHLVTTWATEDNQAERPAYVLAPSVKNYFDPSYRDGLYEDTYAVVQKLIRQGKVDKDRIYVVGKSFGGLATYEFIEKYADEVAGAIAMCGAASYSETAITNAALIKDVPLWIAQAASDDTVSIEDSRKMHAALKEAGSEVVKFTEYTDEQMNEAGVDGKVIGYHTVEIPVLADENYAIWLFEQNNQARREAAEKAESDAAAVTEAEIKAAADVDTLIAAIATATDKNAAITAARTAYDALSATAKSYVTAYNDLREAEIAYKYENQDTEKVTPPKAPTNVKVKKSGKKAIKVNWTKVDDADGYIVYRSNKKKGGYKPVKTITKAKTVSFTDKKVKKGKKYYYKIRAYKAADEVEVLGKYSTVVSVKR